MSREEEVRRIAEDIYHIRQKTGRHGDRDSDWKEAEGWYDKWEREREDI